MAAQRGHCQIVVPLVAVGADVGSARQSGTIPVYTAAQRGYCLIIDALAAVGAVVNRAEQDGSTPAFTAACQGHCQVIEVLVAARADVDRAVQGGLTPVFAAAYQARYQLGDAPSCGPRLVHGDLAPPLADWATDLEVPGTTPDELLSSLSGGSKSSPEEIGLVREIVGHR